MKRDDIPVNPASPWRTQPALASVTPLPPRAAHLHRVRDARRRAPYSHLVTALQVLARQECTREQLADEVQRHHPGEAIAVVSIVRQLAGRELLVYDGERFGLNEAGAALARTEGLVLRHKVTPPRLAQVPHVPGPRHCASPADMVAAPRRPGSLRAADLPSRINDCLHYRDGRITTMDGRVVQPARDPEALYQPSHDGRARTRPVFGTDL